MQSEHFVAGFITIPFPKPEQVAMGGAVMGLPQAHTAGPLCVCVDIHV
jgi:hypothetical protein